MMVMVIVMMLTEFVNNVAPDDDDDAADDGDADDADEGRQNLCICHSAGGNLFAYVQNVLLSILIVIKKYVAVVDH